MLWTHLDSFMLFFPLFIKPCEHRQPCTFYSHQTESSIKCYSCMKGSRIKWGNKWSSFHGSLQNMSPGLRHLKVFIGGIETQKRRKVSVLGIFFYFWKYPLFIGSALNPFYQKHFLLLVFGALRATCLHKHQIPIKTGPSPTLFTLWNLTRNMLRLSLTTMHSIWNMYNSVVND